MGCAIQLPAVSRIDRKCACAETKETRHQQITASILAA
jgi:hypothetical protein